MHSASKVRLLNGGRAVSDNVEAINANWVALKTVAFLHFLLL